MGAADVARGRAQSAGERSAPHKVGGPPLLLSPRLGFLLVALLAELALVALVDSRLADPQTPHSVARRHPNHQQQRTRRHQQASFLEQADDHNEELAARRHLSSSFGHHEPPARRTNHAHHKRRHPAEQQRARTSNSSRSSLATRAVKSKRDAALELAVSRLHILESLDEQLRQFADAAARRVAESAPSTRSCALRLKFGPEPESEPALGPPPCESAGAGWARRVPPYMLNVYQQLELESGSLAEAVRSMPYKSLVMRSFRQPEAYNNAEAAPDDAGRANELVELSALGPPPPQLQPQPPDERPAAAPAHPEEPGAAPACDRAQRRKPAHERSELCYWFRLSEPLRQKINGSLVRTRHSSSWARERLLEAELHVFKLLPELAAVGQQQQQPAGRRRRLLGARPQQPDEAGPMVKQRRPAQSAGTRRNSAQVSAGYNHSNGNFYHLKTNLLEVSLYQILPKKEADGKPQSARLDDEFPLRLLDIRRIDLHSSGWETFYVKRAVEDWISNASLNLGLVIKAKSMFEEPIRIGLIRFADLYDHDQRDTKRDEGARSGDLNASWWSADGARRANASGQQERRSNDLEFDLSHQPVLVIYTTTGADQK